VLNLEYHTYKKKPYSKHTKKYNSNGTDVSGMAQERALKNTGSEQGGRKENNRGGKSY
jgi:hypothetical protein